MKMISFLQVTQLEKFFTKEGTNFQMLSRFFPETMALFSELIQNSDDANSKELVLGFSMREFTSPMMDFHLTWVLQETQRVST